MVGMKTVTEGQLTQQLLGRLDNAQLRRVEDSQDPRTDHKMASRGQLALESRTKP